MIKQLKQFYNINKEDEKKLLKSKTRKELIEMFLPLAKVTADKMRKEYPSYKKVDFDDLNSISSLLLITLIDKYDPNKCHLSLLYYIYRMLPLKIIEHFQYSNFVYHIKQVYPVPRHEFNWDIDWGEKFDVSYLLNTIYNDKVLFKTQYQRDVLKLTIKGYKIGEISKMLNRSYGAVSTVKRSIKIKIYRKYHVIFNDLFGKKNKDV